MPPPSLPLSLSLSLSLFPVDNCDAEIMLREKLVCQRKTAKNNRSRTHQLNPALSDQITFRVGPHYQYACGRAMAPLHPHHSVFCHSRGPLCGSYLQLLWARIVITAVGNRRDAEVLILFCQTDLQRLQGHLERAPEAIPFSTC